MSIPIREYRNTLKSRKYTCLMGVGYSAKDSSVRPDFRLEYMGDPSNSPTILFLPGVATKGRSRRMFLETASTLRQLGYPANVATFDYSSHNGRHIRGFERDEEDVRQAIMMLERDGVPRGKIGLMGACYGAYLSSRYLAENDGLGFAIMAEPYFGEQSLALPYRPFLRAMSKIPKPFGNLLRLPLTNKGAFDRTLNIYQLARFIQKNVSLSGSNVPVLAFMTGMHHFFDRASIERSLEAACAEVVHVSPRDIENENVTPFIRNIDPLLRMVEKG